jgi:NAD(P)-dependent dehydrogenase (short-subunit alcohol dehydrogenase family)
MSGWLAHRTVVVTGASQGIGAATAVALAKRGAHVVATARNQERLAEVIARIREDGGAADAIAADLSAAGAAQRLFAGVDAIGHVDALACCAARLIKATVAETDPDVWQATMRLNLDAVWECCREAFSRMAGNGRGGRLVTIASLSGVYATEKFPGLSAYNTSKFGVIGLTEALAVEGRDVGIAAVCVSPGAVDTDMLRAANPSLTARLTPADVGGLIADLLDGAGFTAYSGANIPLFSNG